MTRKITLLCITMLASLVCLNTSVFASSKAKKPEDYDRDYKGCLINCLYRPINKVCYLGIYWTARHNPNTRIYLAAYKNNKQELISALQDGGDINEGDLVGLASYASPKHLVLLLDHNANPNKGDTWGSTPAHLAISAGNAPNLAVLVQYGARLDMRDKYNNTPSELATKLGHVNCLQVIRAAPLLRQQKIDEDAKELRLMGALEKEEKKRKAHEQETQARNEAPPLPRPAASKALTDEEKKRQQEVAQQKLKDKLEWEQKQMRIAEERKIKDENVRQEQARIDAKQQQRYEQELQAGKQAARRIQYRFKQEKKK